jgi:RHS repeat-associated protein
VLSDGTVAYLYGNSRISEFAGVDWAYYLADALGSVRQLINVNPEVQMAQSFDPYGNTIIAYGEVSSNYGYAGEWTDGTGLQHLRARYLDTGIGRFISRDVWGGDFNNPLSLNRWMYVMGNPVNWGDPSGMYHSEVHLDLTRSLVKQVNPGLAALRNPDKPSQTLADAIAEANQRVDDTWSLNSLNCFTCHFNSFSATLNHVNEAMSAKNLVLFGASLHQLQDYFSHWREGYTKSPGHALDTICSNRTQNKIDDFFYGGHYTYRYFNPKTSQWENKWVSSQYPAHAKEEVISDILYRNPGMTRSDLTNDDLIIDLYLRRDPGFSSSMQSSEQRIKERGYFGIDPDMYVENSSRDIEMRIMSQYYIWLFLLRFNDFDQCNMWEADNQQIKSLLTQ